MFSTGHFFSGVAVGLALGLEGAPLLALVGAAVLTDWDYALQLVTGVNHRRRLTHAPLVVAAVLVPVALVWPLAWWLLAGAMLHFAMDLFDFGLRLNPFSTRIHGLCWLNVDPEARFADYLRAYVRDRRFVALEAFWFAAALAALAWRGIPAW